MRVPIFALLLLASCATTSTTPPVENTAVTKTLLISQHFGRFQDAVAISTDQFGNTYVVDKGGPSVVKYGEKGDSLGVISGFGREQYQFDLPLDVDARLTNVIFIADHNNHRVERYTKDFAYSATIQRRQDDQENLNFGYPKQIAADDAGSIYVIDGENKRVLRVNSSLRPERVLGANMRMNIPGGSFYDPKLLTVDGNNNVIVFDDARAHFVVFDELGNVIKTRGLTSPEASVSFKALAARNDTLFALHDGLGVDMIRLFHTPSMTSIGTWVVNDDTYGGSLDIDVRHGISLLTRNEVLRANVSMTIAPIK
jgi:hypothetical protein